MGRLAALSLVAAFAACASQPSPQPDDMSAAAHRAEAEREREAARRNLDEHRQGSSLLDEALPGDPARLITTDEYGPAGPGIGPRGAGPDLHAAEAHARHAREHEAAARELERFEGTECEGVPVEERAACPLLRGAGGVVDVDGGVEIQFREGAPVDDVYRRVRCHHAFARARGFDETSTCALYLKGIRVERTDPRVIRVTAPDRPTTEQLRRASRAQVPTVR
jgi:hypothetical protein